MIAKKECESRITLLMMEIADTLKEFDPAGNDFSAFMHGKNIMFFNDYDRDNEKRVDFMIEYKGGQK